VGGADLSASVTLGGETFTNVPGGTATWSFAHPNYVGQNGTADIVITRATATVGVNGYTGVYDGAAHGATGTATGVGGVDLSGLFNFGATFTNVPGGTANWTFNTGYANNNYNSASGSVAIIVTVKNVTVTGITANNKPFDSTVAATLNLGGAALVGVVWGDAVTLNMAGAVGTFASAAVGTHAVTISGLTIGPAASNYSLTQPATTASITAWHLNGFHPPVGVVNTYSDSAITSTTRWNTIKGGQTVPLKFNLHSMVGGAELKSVSDVLGFQLVAITCVPSGNEDPVETFPTTGGTSLRYEDGQFIQNWQSPKGANKCYRVTMTARDGSQLNAFFMTK
jgi:hypothetical protein